MVLDAWSASPARFREDANAEEALAVGGYAGRVLVELASNAVDAAREHGVPARIRVRWDDGELRVANTGAPLTAAGVAGLSSLRASAKRDTLGSVGHFGVGFTAVLSWSTSPRVVSITGGVGFDRAATAVAIAALRAPGLDTEVALRRGAVPSLRLPWPTADSEPPPDGYATEVRLPLVPHAIADLERFLSDPNAAEDLFWALPELAEIDLPDRVVRCGREEDLTTLDDGQVQIRYRTAHLAGRTPPELLADRPIEERRRARWSVTWALPAPPGGAGNDALKVPDNGRGRAVGWTVGAPTPTDEPLTLPARLVGTFPVDDTRRRLAPGPLCDFLLDRAADAYLDLIAAVDPAGRWALLPAHGFPAGPVDGTLREAVLHRLEVTPFLVTAVGDLVSLRTACVLPGLGRTGTELFGQAIPGLLPPQPAGAVDVLRTMGDSVLSWSQASAAMAGIDRDPGFWWQVYEAVASAERAPGPDDLADLPVPLVGGRRVLGARGCLLPAVPLDQRQSGSYGRHPAASGTGIQADLARRVGDVIPDLRMVDPAAAHPYLERLGAGPADPDALLADPAVLAALDSMRADLEDFDPEPDEVRELATVVLDLVAAGGRATRVATSDGAEPLSYNGSSPAAALLTELVLTTDDGQPWPASELLLPGADLETVLAGDVDRPTVGREWLGKYSTDVLVAAGVRAGFAVVVIDPSNPPAGPASNVVLPDWDRWLDQAKPAFTTGPSAAVADLDMVDPDCWPQALALIAADRRARACILQGAGCYSAWWLSRHARIGGQLPGYWRLADAADLVGLFDPMPLELDASLAKAIGVCGGLDDATAANAEGLLDRLADPDRTVPAARVAVVTAAVVTALASIEDPDLPSGVRTLSGQVIDADEAWVLDNPWLAQVVPSSRLVPGGTDPELVARVLDLPLASERLGAAVVRPAVVGGVAVVAGTAAESVTRERLRLAAESVGFDLRTATILSDEQLSILVDGEVVAVRWWGAGGRLLTDGSAEGIGRAVAWAAHRWPSRHLAVGAAADDEMAVAEDGVDRPPEDQMLSSSAI